MVVQPVFIMGAPRSGTTLLASMISSRDDTIALPEMHFIHKLFKEETLFGPLTKSHILDSLKNDFTFLELKITQNINEINRLIGAEFKETVFNIIGAYNQKYHKKNFRFWIEHTPHNHKYFSVLRHHFPNAKFVHIVRDGRAVYSSTIEQMWSYQDIITGASIWKQNVEECLSLSILEPNIVCTVRYEDLTWKPDETIREICKFLDMQFTKSMLDSEGGLILPKIKHGKANNIIIIGKPNTKSHEKWKSRLKISEVGHFTSVNRLLLKKFGYDVDQYIGKEFTGLGRLLNLIIGKLKSIHFRRKYLKLRNRSVRLRSFYKNYLYFHLF